MAHPSYVEKLAELLRNTPKKVQVTFSCLLNLYCLLSSETMTKLIWKTVNNCLVPSTKTTQNSLEKVVITNMMITQHSLVTSNNSLVQMVDLKLVQAYSAIALCELPVSFK